ncbi:uncharacterized protein B0I36DRAFT_366937 [Microdochium trichocladiopsis]|uniref:NmrA-like domain-containing protein n=1 Tax=Microdochium trichocladiopsis TaxID=1682393 RepID=A0A9P8XYT5_9PEZI|nr:uncharacterized protein B0I36DRAFT_366937 [Microdochium trichocladiopsis]KAH7025040.1 hypothetical protein B0I36DRAFT_366937 [Microdochium trichocladiopsis]
MSSERILVLGAGELGLAVIRALSAYVKRGGAATRATISVLLRESTLTARPALSRELHALGISNIETADVAASSVEALAHLFSRYDTIVSCNGLTLPPGTQLKLVEAVIQSAGVALGERGTEQRQQQPKKRYFPWQFGVDYDTIGRGSAQDLFDEQLAVRDRLRSPVAAAAGVDWTIITTGLFMSFLFRADFGIVDIGARTVRALGAWDQKLTVTDVADIGAAVAEAAFYPPLPGQGWDGGKAEEDQNGRVLFIAGDTLSYAQIADLVNGRYAADGGSTFERVLWDIPALERQKDKDQNLFMFKYRAMFARGKGIAWEKAGTFGERRALKMTNVNTYLHRLDEEGQLTV